MFRQALRLFLEGMKQLKEFITTIVLSVEL